MLSTLLLVGLQASAAFAAKVVQFDTYKNRAVAAEQRSKVKRASITEVIGNAQNLYYANVTVGTPGQPVQLQLDTGSTDVWMTVTGASFCQQNRANGGCLGGTFDPQQSSSFNVVSRGDFNVSYVDGTGSTGDFFTDTINIGGVAIRNQTMGLAIDTTIGTGIVGVGFRNDESICKSLPCNTYPSIIDSMVNQSRINSAAYSLWLNDLNADTGSILFGGVDTGKYSGNLVGLPIFPDAQTGAITSFTVAWTGLSIGTPNGDETNIVPSFTAPAILDSGTSTAFFPDEVAQSLYSQFGAQFAQELGSYVAPCYLTTANATLNFQFGGSRGATIRVPVSEFLLDLGTDSRGRPFTFANGDVACELGFQAAGDNPILLGDTFLRSAYVVYDLEDNLIGMGQTVFNARSSNVVEISSGSIPGVSSTATEAFASQTATNIQSAGDITGTPNVGAATATGFGTGSAPPLASFTTARYSQSGSSSKGASSGLVVPSPHFSGLFTVVLASVFVFVGSTMILL